MGWTQDEVDKYVAKVERNTNDPTEKNLKGFAFARLYREAKDNNKAKRHLEAYLSVNEADFRSLDLNNTQHDLVLKVVELYCQVPVDPDRARAWADRAARLYPGHTAVFKLRMHLLESAGKIDYDQMEDLISEEMAKRPRDAELHIRLVKVYASTGRLIDAFTHCVSVIKTKAFTNSQEWWRCAIDVFENYLTWPRALKLASVCYLTSIQVIEPEINTPWVATAPKAKDALRWYRMSCHRLSHSGHLLGEVANKYGEEWLDACISDWCTQQSFLANDEDYCLLELHIPSPEQMIKYDEVCVSDNPRNLQLLVWIGLHWHQFEGKMRPGVGVIVSRIFDGLRMDAHNIEQTAADTMSLRDLESLQARSLHYWKEVLVLLEKFERNESIPVRKDPLFDPLQDSLQKVDIKFNIQKARLILGEAAIKEGRIEEAMEMFEQVKTTQGMWNLAQIYKYLSNVEAQAAASEDLGVEAHSSAPAQEYYNCLNKAKDLLLVCMERVGTEERRRQILQDELNDLEDRLNEDPNKAQKATRKQLDFRQLDFQASRSSTTMSDAQESEDNFWLDQPQDGGSKDLIAKLSEVTLNNGYLQEQMAIRDQFVLDLTNKVQNLECEIRELKLHQFSGVLSPANFTSNSSLTSVTTRATPTTMASPITQGTPVMTAPSSTSITPTGSHQRTQQNGYPTESTPVAKPSVKSRLGPRIPAAAEPELPVIDANFFAGLSQSNSPDRRIEQKENEEEEEEEQEEQGSPRHGSYDDGIHFEPIIPLPKKVEKKTGEEGKKVLFSKRAKLYRDDEDDDKEKGSTAGVSGSQTTPKSSTKEQPGVFSAASQEPTVAPAATATTIMPQMFWQQQLEEKFKFGNLHKTQPLAGMAPAFSPVSGKADVLYPASFILSHMAGGSPTGSQAKPSTGTASSTSQVSQRPEMLISLLQGKPKESFPASDSESLKGASSLPTSFASSTTASKGVHPFKTTQEIYDDYSDDDDETETEDSESYDSSEGDFEEGSFATAAHRPTPLLQKVLTQKANSSYNDSAAKASERGGPATETEDDGIHFEPVIPLPKLVSKTTGEENEDTLFCQRAKVFRYDPEGNQWKERGVGEAKILKNTKSGKSRILMRRDNVLKICVNHQITSEMDLQPKTEKSWVWNTLADFADQVPKAETLAIRFKTTEIAIEFKGAFEKVKDEIAGGTSGEKPTEILGQDKVDASHEGEPTQQKSNDEDKGDDQYKGSSADQKTSSTPKEEQSPGPGCTKDQNLNMYRSRTSQQKSAPEEIDPTITTVVEPSNEEKDRAKGLLLPEGFFLYQRKPNADLEASRKTKKEQPNVPETKPVEHSQEDEKQSPKSGVFGSSSSQPFASFSDVCGGQSFQFGEEFKKAFEDCQQKMREKTEDNDSASEQERKCLSCGEPKQVEEPVNVKTLGDKESLDEKSCDDVQHDSGADSSVAKETNPAEESKTGFLFGTQSISSLSFSDAAKSNLFGEVSSSEPFSFKGLNDPQPDHGSKEDDDHEEGYHNVSGDHIHFDPIIPLPEKVQVVTGEEKEEILFKERGKLYRFDTDAKQWKERGVGELKILSMK
ncbi:hypothetical protein QZH41_002159 [Actinostola sp. cb2023]|nr:hypothetical protein QZH41_002159 [Actinostola sp. cb2023]